MRVRTGEAPEVGPVRDPVALAETPPDRIPTLAPAPKRLPVPLAVHPDVFVGARRPHLRPSLGEVLGSKE